MTCEITQKDRYNLCNFLFQNLLTFSTNIYSLLGDYKNRIINSDILGIAFEPEQRFENPDGSEIIFDKDYFDEKRGLSTIPGPFADPALATKILF